MSDDPTPAPEPAATPAPEETALEKRLSSIIGVTKELTQNDQNRNTEIADLKNLVAGLVQKLDTPATQPAPGAPPATQPVDPFSSPAPHADPGVPSTQDFQTAVQAAVQKELQPIMAASAAQNDKLDKHKLSFGKVMQTDPEFAAPGSLEKTYFDQIYAARPDLHVLDDAPLVIANMVKGVLSEERLQAQKVELAKARTTLPSPGGRAAPQGDPEKVREAFAALQTKGEKTPLTSKEMGDYINLATAVAHLE